MDELEFFSTLSVFRVFSSTVSFFVCLWDNSQFKSAAVGRMQISFFTLRFFFESLVVHNQLDHSFLGHSGPLSHQNETPSGDFTDTDSAMW